MCDKMEAGYAMEAMKAGYAMEAMEAGYAMEAMEAIAASLEKSVRESGAALNTAAEKVRLAGHLFPPSVDSCHHAACVQLFGGGAAELSRQPQ
jgi:hypothetical protein